MNTNRANRVRGLQPSATELSSTPINLDTRPEAANPLLFSYDKERVAKARAKLKIEPDQKRALFIAEKSRADFVYNTAALEGNPFTFPEIQTLIDGITVGGHKLTDAEQVLRLNQALTFVMRLVKDNEFTFTSTTAKTIQGMVAKDEALQWGVFRDQAVFIAGSDFQVPPARELEAIFENGRAYLERLQDPIHKAFLVFLWGSLIQFFYDGNKRTSRFMCNGILMSAGYPPMMILKTEQLQYNQVMSDFYNTQDATQAMVWFYERYLERVSRFGFGASSTSPL